MTAIDTLLNEERISLTQLAKREKVCTSTVWRWTTRGSGGHRLEHFCVGGRKFTTEEAFARWVSRLSSQGEPSPETPRQRERAIDRAERELAAMGI